jgi:hypothetical protein
MCGLKRPHVEGLRRSAGRAHTGGRDYSFLKPAALGPSCRGDDAAGDGIRDGPELRLRTEPTGCVASKGHMLKACGARPAGPIQEEGIC